MNTNVFIEIDHAQVCKRGQGISGDFFLSQKIAEEERVVSVLADGLGSGVKASVLATLTATMAVNFIANRIDAKRAAKIILDSLPVCKTRKIGYSTFAIADIDAQRNVTIIEHDNPPFLLFRDLELLDLEKQEIPVERRRQPRGGAITPLLHTCRFQAIEGDRILLFSDGVNQSGMGSRKFPLGWGMEALREFAWRCIRKEPQISARDLAHAIVTHAEANDEFAAKDDITCAVLYFRKPRTLLVLTGPPLSRENDAQLATYFNNFPGHKALCGGTTAGIIARELRRPLSVDIRNLDPDVPPASIMEGADLVTEGTITLGIVASLLENGFEPETVTRPTPATRLAELLLTSDVIQFVVGTRINEAHQDPNIPVELEIRRNVVKKIRDLLERQHLKSAAIRFV